MTNNRTASNIALPNARDTVIVALAALGLIATLWLGSAGGKDDDSRWRANVDLGIDVSGVLKTPLGVRTFLSALGAKTERVIINACAHYIETPDIIIGPDTLSFCSIAVRS